MKGIVTLKLVTSKKEATDTESTPGMLLAAVLVEGSLG